MANASAIKITITGALDNGNLDLGFQPGQITIEQDRALAHSPIVSIGTSEEALVTGDLATLGWLLMQNLDAANYVIFGPESGGAMVACGRIKAGETAAFRLEPGITLRMQANTAACLMRLEWWNN